MNAIHAAYYDALAADNAWHTELVRMFGKAAGDARYTKLGVSTVYLQKLHREFALATEAYRTLCGSR